MIKMCGEDSIQSKFMKLTHLYYRNSFSIFKEMEIHPKQVPIMIILDQEEGVSQKEISQKLNISAPTVAVSMKRLEKSGLIERRPDEKDQRKTRIYLTNQGKEIIEKSRACVSENEKLLFRGFSESEICLMKRFFDQMIGNLGSEGSKGGKTLC